MKTELRVMEVNKEGSELSNRYIELYIPKRSKLLKGKKLKEGDLYTITLEKVKPKKRK